jgi:hypothetical protein
LARLSELAIIGLREQYALNLIEQPGFFVLFLDAYLNSPYEEKDGFFFIFSHQILLN